jgi:hypothetical protein
MYLRITAIIFACGALFAQETRMGMISIAASPVGVEGVMAGSIKGAPYSATVITERTQTLSDGNRITEKHSSMVARDSEGRVRNEATLMAIGTAPVAGGPAQIVMILDPVQQVSYTLEMNSKTARKRSMQPGREVDARQRVEFDRSTTVSVTAGVAMTNQVVIRDKGSAERKTKDQPDMHKESLGTQVIEGVLAEGSKTIRTIPAGEIGNERAIEIVDEVWTSPDLKTVVLSKHSDPRMGEMTYRLTNISRAEPAASLFMVPADFKVVEGGEANFVYRPRD